MQKFAPETKKPVPAEVDLGAYRIADPEAFGRNMLRLMEEGQKVMSGLLERVDGKTGPYSAASEMTDAAKLFSEIMQPWVAEPAKLVEAQGALFGNYMQLVANTAQRAMGGAGAASGGAGGRRQPVQRSRVEPQSLLRLLEAVLSHHHALARGPARQDRRARRAHAPARRVLSEAAGERALALQLPADQSGGDARDVRSRAARTSCRA